MKLCLIEKLTVNNTEQIIKLRLLIIVNDQDIDNVWYVKALKELTEIEKQK